MLDFNLFALLHAFLRSMDSAFQCIKQNAGANQNVSVLEIVHRIHLHMLL